MKNMLNQKEVKILRGSSVFQFGKTFESLKADALSNSSDQIFRSSLLAISNKSKFLVISSPREFQLHDASKLNEETKIPGDDEVISVKIRKQNAVIRGIDLNPDQTKLLIYHLGSISLFYLTSLAEKVLIMTYIFEKCNN